MKSTFWQVCILFVTLSTGSNAETLPGTEPLTISDDIASNLVAGADRFLLKKIEQAAIRCINDLKTAVSTGTELKEQREKLRAMLGLLDPPLQFEELELLSTVAYEFAKVRHLYAARLKLPDRAQIEWFAGPHTINGKGTFDFLHKHLKWPAPNQ